MKFTTFILLLLAISFNSTGQSKIMNHLINDRRNEYRPYLTAGIQVTQLRLYPTIIEELGAGVLINRKISIGYDYSKSILNIFLPSSKQDGQIEMLKKALHLEYTLWPKEKVHLSLPLEIGSGHLGIKGLATDKITGNPDFTFIEPGIILEENLWKYAKIGLGAKYRYAFNVNYCYLQSNDISRFTAVLYIKLGKFTIPKH